MKTLLAIAISIGAGIAQAAPITLTNNFAPDKIHSCMKAGWAAASTTPDQDAQAQTIMSALLTDLQTQAPNIQSLQRSLMVAWMAHPIDLNSVNFARNNLDSAMSNVQSAVTEATVNTINLLNISQRGAFDHGFMACMRQ